MYKELPFVKTAMKTYQGSSFIGNVIFSYDNVKNEYYNHYINIGSKSIDSVSIRGNIALNYIDSIWDHYLNNGLAEMQLYYIKNLDKSKFISFLRERIDQNNYILFYKIDEFYLSYSDNYMKMHYIHDTYIYGYVNDFFIVFAYSKNKLERLLVPMEEIVEGIYNTLKEADDLSFCTFRVNKHVSVNLNIDMIKKNISEYLLPEQLDDDHVYGIKTYEVIEKYLDMLKRCKNDELKIDMRVFRFLWEHKTIMKERFLYVSNICPIFKIETIKINDLENLSSSVFMMMLKYSVTKKKKLVELSMCRIREIQIKEENIFREILNL